VLDQPALEWPIVSITVFIKAREVRIRAGLVQVLIINYIIFRSGCQPQPT
jgi:hypothetical protein